MTDDAGNDEGLKALKLMIAYARDEAARLRIMDIAMLLDSANDAVMAFSPVLAPDRSLDRHREGTIVEH